jgi:hypothetical protein
MSKKKDADEKAFVCPVGRFFMSFEGKGGKRSPFFDHLSRSGLEFLKAVRALVDEKIEVLEKKEKKGGGRTATKIEVE